MKRLPFLGHVIEAKRISPDPEKIIAIQNILPPKNVTQLRSFLGLAEYYKDLYKDSLLSLNL